jgi:hypothetical protein
MHEQSVRGFVNKDIDSSLQVIELYSKFNKILRIINQNYITNKGTNKGTNMEFVLSTINSTSTMDKIALCWVDIADLIKPVYVKE